MGVTHANLGPIWYHSGPSDVTYLPNQLLGWDTSCLQDGSSNALVNDQNHYFGFGPIPKPKP